MGAEASIQFSKKEELLVLGNMYDSNVIYKAINQSVEGLGENTQSNAALSGQKKQNMPAETVSEKKEVTDDSGIKWFTLNKGIGPFTIKRIGAAAKQEGNEYKVFLYLDTKMSFSVVDIELMGLSVGVPISVLTSFRLSNLKKLEFGMMGLGISFQKGPLSISGCFLRTKGVRERYDGAVMIKFMEFQFVGIGSYTTTEDGKASLFLYLMVGAPIGGVGAFFVTGLAAGFGVNRGIRIPDVKNVKSFPLVSMVMEEKSH